MAGMKKKVESISGKYKPLAGKPGKGKAKKQSAKKPDLTKPVRPMKRGR